MSLLPPRKLDHITRVDGGEVRAAENSAISLTGCLQVRGENQYDGYRIADIDSPEISSPKCAAELALGEQAMRRCPPGFVLGLIGQLQAHTRC
jgi:hypothetical protein